MPVCYARPRCLARPPLVASVALQLTCCATARSVPASHKANFPMPREIASSPTRDIGTARRGQRGDGIHPPVVNPTCPIGSLLIFLEATYHTTLPCVSSLSAAPGVLPSV